MSTGSNFVNGLIGKLFDQAVKVATTDGSSLQNTGVELSDSNNKFTATFTDTISFIQNVGTSGQAKNGLSNMQAVQIYMLGLLPS